MSSTQLKEMAEFYRVMSERIAPDSVDLATKRDIVERMHLLSSEPMDVVYEEVDAGGVPALWVTPRDADESRVLLHSHSGGSVLTTMHTDRKAIAHVAKAAGVRALIVDFRKAPEHVFPALLDDVETAYRWLLDQGIAPEHVVSFGHSIGGNLSVNLALTLKRKGAPLPGAVVSLSPWFDMEMKNETILAHAATDMQISKAGLESFRELMLNGSGVDKHDPRINLAQADPSGLPPTLIYYGTFEVLAGDSIDFAARAERADVDVTLKSLDEGQHNFVLGAGKIPEVDAAIAEIASWLRPKIGLTN